MRCRQMQMVVTVVVEVRGQCAPVQWSALGTVSTSSGQVAGWLGSGGAAQNWPGHPPPPARRLAFLRAGPRRAARRSGRLSSAGCLVPHTPLCRESYRGYREDTLQVTDSLQLPRRVQRVTGQQ